MTEQEITEKLKAIIEHLPATYGEYTYPIEFVTMDGVQLYHLFFVNRANTKNVLSEIKELKKWAPMNTVLTGYLDLDSLYRWEAVENDRQLIAFQVKEHEVQNEKGVVMCYLLLDIAELQSKNVKKQHGKFIGIRFKRNYSN